VNETCPPKSLKPYQESEPTPPICSTSGPCSRQPVKPASKSPPPVEVPDPVPNAPPSKPARGFAAAEPLGAAAPAPVPAPLRRPVMGFVVGVRRFLAGADTSGYGFVSMLYYVDKNAQDDGKFTFVGSPIIRISELALL